MVVTETTKVENVSVIVTVDSAEDIESTFNIEDIKQIIESSATNEVVSFKIIGNENYRSNGNKSSLSYRVEGNSNDLESFLIGIEKIRTSAINYYYNKN